MNYQKKYNYLKKEKIKLFTYIKKQVLLLYYFMFEGLGTTFSKQLELIYKELISVELTVKNNINQV